MKSTTAITSGLKSLDLEGLKPMTGFAPMDESKLAKRSTPARTRGTNESIPPFWKDH